MIFIGCVSVTFRSLSPSDPSLSTADLENNSIYRNVYRLHTKMTQAFQQINSILSQNSSEDLSNILLTRTSKSLKEDLQFNGLTNKPCIVFIRDLCRVETENVTNKP